MRKTILFLLPIILSIMAVIFWRKVGDLRPAILPAKKDITNIRLSQSDFRLEIYASDITNARDLEFTTDGTLLVSSPQTGNVYTLPDRKIILSNLNRPHGLSFHDGQLFVAEETKVIRYNWDEKNKTATIDKKILDLPSGGRHFTRSMDFDSNGRLFISLGSTCDVCFETHPWIGTVIVTNKRGENPRVWSRGLRNAVFIKVDENTNELWGTEMGRDFLGDDLPPDEINILKEGHDYGWPVCYGNRVYDSKFGKKTSSYCQNTTPPSYEIPAHSAPLGLVFYHGDLLVAYHGSWNSSVPVGYKIVRLKRKNDRIVASEDFISGFVDGSRVVGRPVDIELGRDGSLYISDDKRDVVYKIKGQ
ncbi:MAG: PQQ-dependent sugar dehydrogenase [Bdellovibrio sp.]|nr:PQQ-dependent sugar dehydrogenase [Bdellovibrio sp.]